MFGVQCCFLIDFPALLIHYYIAFWNPLCMMESQLLTSIVVFMSGWCKLQSTGLIQPTACFYVVCALRVVFTSLNGWEKYLGVKLQGFIQLKYTLPKSFPECLNQFILQITRLHIFTSNQYFILAILMSTVWS